MRIANPDPTPSLRGYSRKFQSRFANTKTLAMIMDCHSDTVAKWSQKLNVPPDVRGHGLNRWYWHNAGKLIVRWRRYCSISKICQNWNNGRVRARAPK